MRFLKSWFVCALAIALAIYLVPGIVSSSHPFFTAATLVC